MSITGLPSLFEMKQTRTATCSGTQPAIELDFGLPPLPKKSLARKSLSPRPGQPQKAPFSAKKGGELLCAPKQLRHYHSPDDLSWDEWRLSDSEIERIDLENAASPEEADELEEMTADEMAVDGYYVVAGIARHEYKQGWKFLTLWDGYGLSEATWEPMSAFIQPDGSINPIFRTYLVENNEGQLLTRAETMSQRKKRN